MLRFVQIDEPSSMLKNKRPVEQKKRVSESAKRASKPRLYSAVDLFAGCGGLSLGLENAGFTSVFVNELNNDALASYLLNRRHRLGGLAFSENDALHSNDAHDLKGKRLQQLRSDLSAIPELNFQIDANGSSLDIIAGGPPCQGYSGIGHRRSYSVEKKDLPSNQLYARMAAIISSLRPRIFLFENVRGILTSSWTRGGADKIWPDVLAEFRSITGYHVRWKLVRAKDYGVPQNRPRVLMVGIRADVVESCHFIDIAAHPEDAVICGFLPSPRKDSYPSLKELLDDLIDPEVDSILRGGNFPTGAFATTKYPRSAKSAIQRNLRQPQPGSVSPVYLTEQEYSKHKPEIVAKFTHMLANGGKIPEHFSTKKFSQRLLLPEWGPSGPTITATSLPDDYVHFAQPRILTVREWARLQLFPDWYQFVGKRTTGGLRRAGNPRKGLYDREAPKYTQIGNAVPVGLAEHVGKHFRQILDEALGTYV